MAFQETLRENRRAARNVVLLTALFLSSLWGFFAYWAIYHRQEAISTSEAGLLQMNHAVEQYVQHMVNTAEIFQATAERWLEENATTDPCDDPGFHALIGDFRQRTGSLIDVRLITSNGGLFYFPCRSNQPLDNVADREYFRAVIDAPPGRRHIGTPVISRVSGQWRLPITVRMRKPHYGLEVINASINLSVLGAAFEAERPKPDGSISFWRDDGTLLARAPQTEHLVGKPVVANYVPWETMLSERSGVIQVNRSPVDNTNRFISFKRFDRYPLVVTVTSTVESTLATWRWQVLIGALALLVVTLWGSAFTLKLIRALRKIEANTEELQLLATQDAATGLFNRRYLMETGQHELARMRRYGSPLALMMLDVDHFKRVNDTWGHPVGDRVLQGVAQVMKTMVRDQDTVGRLGGEEFAVVLPETDRAGVLAIAERMRAAVEADPLAMADDGALVRVTVSIGVTVVRPENDSFEEALMRADQALYKAKDGGRNRVIDG